MAKPGFYLKNAKATNPTLVFLIHKLPGGKNFKYSTGESVHPSQWDKATQRTKTNLRGNPAQLIRNKETNMQLERYNLKFTEILAGIKAANEQPTVEKLRELMDKDFLKANHPRRMEEAAKRPTLLTFIEKWINTVKFTRENPPRPISKRTLMKYKTTMKLLRAFADDKRRGKLDFDGIDMDFYFDFMEYLQTTQLHGQNTVGKHIKVVKLFMREAVDAGLTTNITHENRRFAATSEEVEHIYLTEGELTAIAELDLSNKPSLDRVRDLFLIGAFTALRFSDFTTIRPENIITTSDGGKALKINTRKTGQKVVIPIHSTVERILEKYDSQLPRAISNQKMNVYLKEIAALAGITSPFEITKTIGGKRVQTTLPKWRLVTTHTARRSGATQTEAAFMRYICISEEDNAKLLMQHDYFRPKMKIV